MASFANKLNRLIGGESTPQSTIKPLVGKAVKKATTKPLPSQAVKSNAQRETTEKAMNSAYKATKTFK